MRSDNDVINALKLTSMAVQYKGSFLNTYISKVTDHKSWLYNLRISKLCFGIMSVYTVEIINDILMMLRRMLLKALLKVTMISLNINYA